MRNLNQVLNLEKLEYIFFIEILYTHFSDTVGLLKYTFIKHILLVKIVDR